MSNGYVREPSDGPCGSIKVKKKEANQDEDMES
jgi:hypothetical protein